MRDLDFIFDLSFFTNDYNIVIIYNIMVVITIDELVDNTWL